MVDSDFREVVHINRWISQYPISKSSLFFFVVSHYLLSTFQVRVAYKNKVQEVLNRGLDEEELSKEMELLKVGGGGCVVC